MASWRELPYPILCRIFSFLPTFDVVSISKVCAGWKHIAVKFLEKIEINDSTTNLGSFFEYNRQAEGLLGHQDDVKLFNFINYLTESTDEIHYFDIDVLELSGRCLDKLLISQKAIKSLVVRVRKRPPDETCIDAVVRAIIKHESTLEKINIGIQGYFIRFTCLADGLKEKESCFQNLKSIEFLSTTAGSFGLSAESYRPLGPIDEERNAATEMFQKIFNKSKNEELNFRPKLPLQLVHSAPEVYWHPVYIRILIKYFQRGAFSNLRKININSLNTGGIGWHFSDSEAEMLMQHCPLITHIGSDINFLELSEYFHPIYDEEPLIKLVKHFGNQLVYFNVMFMSSNIAKSVYENCTNLRSITIFDTKDVGLTDEALMLLTELQHLKSLKLIIEVTQLKKETILMFLNKVVEKLEKLTVVYREETIFDPNILEIISQNGKNLRKLNVIFTLSSADIKQAIDGLLAMLQKCTDLKSLVFICDPQPSLKAPTETYSASFETLIEILVKRHQQLKFASICFEGNLEKYYKEKMINVMDKCRLEFESEGICSMGIKV